MFTCTSHWHQTTVSVLVLQEIIVRQPPIFCLLSQRTAECFTYCVQRSRMSAHSLCHHSLERLFISMWLYFKQLKSRTARFIAGSRKNSQNCVTASWISRNNVAVSSGHRANLVGGCDIDLQWTQCFTGPHCVNQSLSHTYIYEETSLSLV